MNAIFRHLAVRFWATAVLGGLVSLFVLPWWQQLAGVQWIPLVVGILLAILFVSVGWGMNRLGLMLIARLMNEAAVWERAGMGAEARDAFERVAALFDSFWLSVSQRHKRTRFITARLARFSLSQRKLSSRGRSLILYYLNRFPQDEAVALRWLGYLLTQEGPLAAEHETADRIGEAHPRHAQVQQLLLHFYLANARSDFIALQAYQNAWQNQALQEPDRLLAVARLLLSAQQLNDWTLALYLQAFEAGHTDCLPGIVASARWLPRTTDNQLLLQKAQKIAADLKPEQRATLASRFRPVERPAVTKSKQRPSKRFSAAEQRLAVKMETAARILMFHLKGLPALANRSLMQWRRSAALRLVLTAAGLVAALTVLSIAGWRFFSLPPEVADVPPPVEQLPPLTTDPFTIQVAAYLKAEDAKHYVDQLKGNGLDAFWTEATSAHRRWYQVKVSHFPTKAAAQSYAEQLKAEGLINDFYVANYTPPQAQSR